LPVEDDLEVVGTFGAGVGPQQQETAVGADVVGKPGKVGIGAFDDDFGPPCAETGAVCGGFEYWGRIETVAVTEVNAFAVGGRDCPR